MATLEQRHREFIAELELDADAVLGDRLAALRNLLTDPRAATRAAKIAAVTAVRACEQR